MPNSGPVKPHVLIGADHRGVKLKAECLSWLKSHGYEVTDLGTHSEERCDALDFATKLAEAFRAKTDQMGVLICGSGQAMAITANRYRDIRAALCINAEMARMAREHNDANVLALGADFTDTQTALKCLEAFLNARFLAGRYAERRDRLTQLGGL